MTIVSLLAVAKAAPKAGGSSLFYILIGGVVLMYVVLVRPQRQRAQRQQKAMKEIDVGDEVVTAGGIVGRVTSMEGDRVWLELDAGVVVEFLRQAVARKVEPVAGDSSDSPSDVAGRKVVGHDSTDGDLPDSGVPDVDLADHHDSASVGVPDVDLADHHDSASVDVPDHHVPDVEYHPADAVADPEVEDPPPGGRSGSTALRDWDGQVPDPDRPRPVGRDDEGPSS
ncbi:MAG: preprotein translocase subunit YajC [Actinomycetota bacterium]|nr:preprotein translocase subunit YajC [Actinomycetota bacterium]